VKLRLDTPPGTPCELCSSGKRGRRRVQTRLDALPWLCPRCRGALLAAALALTWATLRPGDVLVSQDGRAAVVVRLGPYPHAGRGCRGEPGVLLRRADGPHSWWALLDGLWRRWSILPRQADRQWS